MATTICTPCSQENNIGKDPHGFPAKHIAIYYAQKRSPQIHPVHHDTCFFDHEILRFNFLLFDVLLVAIPF